MNIRLSGLLAIMAYCGSIAAANTLAPWVGPNVLLGEDPEALPGGNGKNQAEPHIARSIADPDLLLATFQEGRFSDGGAVCNGYAVSRDGGFSWQRALNPELTFVSGGSYHRATDPVAGISSDGVLYLNSLVAMDADFNQGRLVVQRSYDLGNSWSDPITVYTGTYAGMNYRIFPDKNWMAVNDLDGSPHEGRMVVTWTNFRTETSILKQIDDFLIMCAWSDDEGSTWSDPVFVTPPGSPNASNLQYQGSQPVFMPGGGLAIVYHNFLGTRLEVRYSPDGGESFPYAATPLHDQYILYDAPNMRDGTFLPSVGMARETGDIYVAYTSRQALGDNYGKIHFIRSRRNSPVAPNGQVPDWRFTDPVVVSGLSPQRVTCTPSLSVSPDGQVVTIHYYDSQNEFGNTSGDFYAVQSTNGGTTWGTPFRISESTFPLDRATWTTRGYMLGDYFGIAPPVGPGQATVAVWIGTPLATADPWSARIGQIGENAYDSWLQAQLTYQERSIPGIDEEQDRYGDPDRDGAPNIIEFVLGRSPRIPDALPELTNGFSHFLLADSVGSEWTPAVYGGTGSWPAEAMRQAVNPSVISHGEGYWNQLTWSTAGTLDHLQFVFESGEHWFLLPPTAPSRWVLRDEDNDEWVWSPWLGSYNTRHAPWLYHHQLGWLFDLGGALYHAGMDTYLFPDPQHFPWIYRSDGSYIYLSEAGPWYYDTASSTWLWTKGLPAND